MTDNEQIKSEILAIREAADYFIDPQIMQLKIQARCSPKDFESMLYELFPGSVKMDGRTAWMSIKGPLRGEDYDNIMHSLAELENSAMVETLILDINSPGGSVAGCGETAEAISKFSKPVYAVADGMMCSAAYWIGSQADEVAASESCSVGSVGVIATHMSLKGAYDKMGVKITEVAKGNKKNLFSPNKELSEKGKTELQSQVDLFFGKFVNAVKSKRTALSDKVLDSGVFYGKDAIEAGLIDTIVNNKSTMSVFTKNKEAPPIKSEDNSAEKSVTGTEIKQAIEAAQREILNFVEKKSDERFDALKPLIDDYNERKAKEQEAEEERAAIELINAKRKAKGLPLLVEDKMDDDDKDKSDKKAPKEDYKDKKAESKDDTIAKLNERIDALCKVIEKGGLGVHDPIAVDPDASNGLADKVQLKSTGRTIPVTKSWEWCYTKAADIRSWLQEQGTVDEVKEFDSIIVPQIKQELTKAGVSKPRNLFALMKGN